MEVEYKKDLRHSYMVITEGGDTIEIEPYCLKMLGHQSIDGLLLVEQRRMDNKILFYYEITAKQSMINILDKTILTYDRVKQLFTSILRTIGIAYEYLLPQDDIVLSPEYIYMEVASNSPFLCFLSGYHKSINDQIRSLIEYLMNKVDYNDKDAVLLVYQLYAVSREEGFTYDHLLEVLQKKAKATPEVMINKKGTPDSENIQVIKDTSLPSSDASNFKNISKMPVMMEKLEGEEEVPCYPLNTYLYTAACVIGGILVIILGRITGIVYNSFGDRIDYSKLFAVLLIVFCLEGYLLKIIWDKKNKITKLIKTKEYIDPRKELGYSDVEIGSITNINEIKQLNQKNSFFNQLDKNSLVLQEQRKINLQPRQVEPTFSDQEMEPEEEDNPTCLLNEKEKLTSLVLKPLEDTKYKSIPITEFPFFIGKLKKKVDYCLEKDVVSRFHAKILKENGQYFLMDLNSTNGTFVNQEPLQTYQKKEIKLGDEVAFANIKYLFMLETS